jgi:hypothetical protein
MKILWFKIINNNYYFNKYYFFQVCAYRISRSYKILSFLTISTPSPLDDLKECNEHFWKIEDDEENEENNENDEEIDDYF